MTIEIRHLRKKFHDFVALGDVSLTINDGELVALLGPSGSGKTTLLRLIAGLDYPSSGEILFSGEDASHRHVGERQVGFVFQHYALFRHMTVLENVAFGLRVKPKRERPSDKEIHERVMTLLRLVQLEPFARRYPSQLSGGQRQRVALARALAIEPRVLLLDEPFGALDAKVRKELRRWLRNLHDEMQLTSVFVTHDQEEALDLADRVVVMDHGKIEQVGTPVEVYNNPATPFVFEFLGNVNRLDCRIRDGAVDVLAIPHTVPREAMATGGTPVAYVRPHDIEIVPHGLQAGQAAIITHVAAAGPTIRIELFIEGDERHIEADISREKLRQLDISVGQQVCVRPRDARIFFANGERAV